MLLNIILVVTLIVAITAAILLLLRNFYQPFFLVRMVQQCMPGIIFYVPTKSNYYSLTFDDGPNPPYTDKVLEILKRFNVRATFFLIGSQVEKHPEYVALIRKDGHQVANHQYSRKPNIFLSPSQMLDSLEKTEQLVNQTTDTKYFRPASGWIFSKELRVARENNYQAVIGSAFVSDHYNPSRWFMLHALTRMARPGAIIVLHDGNVIGNRQRVVDVLVPLLKHLKMKNLTSVTLDELVRS